MAIKQMLGLYESSVRDLLKDMRGDCFYDIGANVGHYSLLLRHNFCRIYAVEPVPRNVTRLRRRLSIRFVRNVKVLPVALSNTSGEAALYINSDRKNLLNNFSASSLIENFESRSCDGGPDRTYAGIPIRVQTTTFDTLLSEPTADLVKIDVEGAEFLVLDGMKESLARHRVRNILVELHDRGRKKELQTIIDSHFNDVSWIDEQHVYGRNRHTEA